MSKEANDLCIQTMTAVLSGDLVLAFELIRHVPHRELRIAMLLQTYSLAEVLSALAESVGEDIREFWARDAHNLCLQTMKAVFSGDPVLAFELISNVSDCELRIAMLLQTYSLAEVLRALAENVGEDVRESWAREAFYLARRKSA